MSLVDYNDLALAAIGRANIFKLVQAILHEDYSVHIPLPLYWAALHPPVTRCKIFAAVFGNEQVLARLTPTPFHSLLEQLHVLFLDQYTNLSHIVLEFCLTKIIRRFPVKSSTFSLAKLVQICCQQKDFRLGKILLSYFTKYHAQDEWIWGLIKGNFVEFMAYLPTPIRTFSWIKYISSVEMAQALNIPLKLGYGFRSHRIIKYILAKNHYSSAELNYHLKYCKRKYAPKTVLEFIKYGANHPRRLVQSLCLRNKNFNKKCEALIKSLEFPIATCDIVHLLIMHICNVELIIALLQYYRTVRPSVLLAYCEAASIHGQGVYYAVINKMGYPFELHSFLTPREFKEVNSIDVMNNFIREHEFMYQFATIFSKLTDADFYWLYNKFHISEAPKWLLRVLIYNDDPLSATLQWRLLRLLDACGYIKKHALFFCEDLAQCGRSDYAELFVMAFSYLNLEDQCAVIKLAPLRLRRAVKYLNFI